MSSPAKRTGSQRKPSQRNVLESSTRSGANLNNSNSNTMNQSTRNNNNNTNTATLGTRKKSFSKSATVVVVDPQQQQQQLRKTPRTMAAVVIQCAYRKHLAKRHAMRMRQETLAVAHKVVFSEVAAIIQSFCRAYQMRHVLREQGHQWVTNRQHNAATQIQCLVRRRIANHNAIVSRNKRNFDYRVDEEDEEKAFLMVRIEAAARLQVCWRIALARRVLRHRRKALDFLDLSNVEDEKKNIHLDARLPPSCGALVELQSIAFEIGQQYDQTYHLNALCACTDDAEAMERELIDTHWGLPIGLSYLFVCADLSKSSSSTSKMVGLELLREARNLPPLPPEAEQITSVTTTSTEFIAPSPRHRQEDQQQQQDLVMIVAPPPPQSVPTFSPSLPTHHVVTQYHVPKSLTEREQRIQHLRRMVIIKKVTRIQRWWRRVFFKIRSERYQRVVKHLSVLNECASRIQSWWRNGCSSHGPVATKEMLQERLAVMEDRLKMEQHRVERTRRQDELRHLWFTMTRHPLAPKPAAAEQSSSSSLMVSNNKSPLPPLVKTPARSRSTIPVRSATKRQPPEVPSGRYAPTWSSGQIFSWNSSTNLKRATQKKKGIPHHLPHGMTMADGQQHYHPDDSVLQTVTTDSVCSTASIRNDPNHVPFAVMWRKKYWPMVGRKNKQQQQQQNVSDMSGSPRGGEYDMDNSVTSSRSNRSRHMQPGDPENV
eukprot:PhF_6_TR526/c2_g1_i2/m.353